MASKTNTGGVKTFVDNGNHHSQLTAQETEKLNQAYNKAKERRSTLKYKIKKLLFGITD